MRTRFNGSLAAVVLILGGCAVNPTECDPRNRDASLYLKAACGDEYNKRQVEKQQILLDEQKTNQLFRDLYTALEKEKSEVKTELQGKRAEYNALQKALGALLTEIKTKAKGNQAIEKEIKDLEQQLATITTQNDPVVMQKQQQLDELKDKAMQLEQNLGLR